MIRLKMSHILVLLSILMMSDATLAGSKCQSFASFIDLTVKKNVSPARAYELSKGFNEIEKATEIRIIDDSGKEVQVTYEGYEDGALLYRRSDSEDVISFDPLDKDARSFFRIDGEAPVQRVASVDDVDIIGPRIPDDAIKAPEQLELPLVGGAGDAPEVASRVRLEVDSAPTVSRSTSDQMELPGLEKQPELPFDFPAARPSVATSATKPDLIGPVRPDPIGPVRPPNVVSSVNDVAPIGRVKPETLTPVKPDAAPVVPARIEAPRVARIEAPKAPEAPIPRENALVVRPNTDGVLVGRVKPETLTPVKPDAAPVVPARIEAPRVARIEAPKAPEAPIPRENALVVRPNTDGVLVGRVKPETLTPVKPDAAPVVPARIEAPRVARIEAPKAPEAPIPRENALVVRPNTDGVLVGRVKPETLTPVKPDAAPVVPARIEAPRVARIEAPKAPEAPIPRENALVVRPNTDGVLVGRVKPETLTPVKAEVAPIVPTKPTRPTVTTQIEAPKPPRVEQSSPIAIENLTVRGESPQANILRPADPVPARVIPGKPNFGLVAKGRDISFSTPAGSVRTRGRVVAVNRQSVRIADSSGGERTIRFREIDSDSLKVHGPTEVIGKPSTGRAQPSRADFPESQVGQEVSFTTPAGQKRIQGRIVKVNDQSIRINVNGVERTYRYRNINGDSVTFSTASKPANIAPSTGRETARRSNPPATSTAVVPAARVTDVKPVTRTDVVPSTGTDVDTVTLTGEIVDNTDVIPRQMPAASLERPFIEGTFTRIDDSLPALTARTTDVKPATRTDVVPSTGTDVDSITLTGEIVDNTDVVPRQMPVASLERPFIEGSLSRIDDSLPAPQRAVADARPSRSLPRSVASRADSVTPPRDLPRTIAGVPDEFSPAFRQGQKVTFATKNGKEYTGTFKGLDDGKAIIELEDGSIIRVAFDDIDVKTIQSRLSPHSATTDDYARLAEHQYEFDFKFGDEFAGSANKSRESASASMRLFDRIGKGPFRILNHGSRFIRVVSKATGKVTRIPISLLKRSGISMGIKRGLGVTPELTKGLGRYYRGLQEGENDETPTVDNGESVGPSPTPPTPAPTTETAGEEEESPSAEDQSFQEYGGEEDVIDEDEFLPPPRQAPPQGPGRQPFRPTPLHKSGIQIKQGVF